MDRDELKKKIAGLEHYISNQEVKKARNILYIAITLFTILGGGLVLGLIFGSLAKIMMLAIAVAALVNVDALKAIGNANNTIKRCNDQIAAYRKEGNKDMVNKQAVIKEVQKEKTKDYAYKPEKSKSEIKIEHFDENDFSDNRSSKRR